MTSVSDVAGDALCSGAGPEYREFLKSFPDYAETSHLDVLRATEFERLDRLGHIYLDYTGSSLYSASQVERHSALLLGGVLGNPHSQNPTSEEASRSVEEARRSVLDFFNASPDDYCVVFTSNASHALKLVGESYPFTAAGRFLLTFDNHNSVNGIREFARTRGTPVTYVPVVPPDLRADSAVVERALSEPASGGHRLFAYPAQSNFSGVQHPLEWVALAQSHGWDVLLDAAAFVPTNRLDLRRVKPDYVSLSFYKMFGYPTGIGALIARRESLAKLQRPWFAGGTITVASVGADRHYLASGEAAFEDGTANFICLAAVGIGLDFIRRVGIDLIHRRVNALTGWLLRQLVGLRHSTGRPLVALYGPETTEARGGTLTLNFHNAAGEFIDHQAIEAAASERRISIRSGCFCNPGAGEIALGITADDMKACFARSSARMTYDDFRRCIDGGSSGAVRVSLGLASNFADVNAFVQFARTFIR